MNDPADLTLVDLLPRLRDRSLSARELLDACLARVEQHEPAVRPEPGLVERPGLDGEARALVQRDRADPRVAPHARRAVRDGVLDARRDEACADALPAAVGPGRHPADAPVARVRVGGVRLGDDARDGDRRRPHAVVDGEVPGAGIVVARPDDVPRRSARSQDSESQRPDPRDRRPLDRCRQ